MATTTYYLSAISLIVQYFQNLGLMAGNGDLYTYTAGTTAPVTTYTDATGLVANPNPMELSATGRPQSPSGAPVAFWVPGGTNVKLLVYDSAGNLLVSIDNVPAINDLTNSNNALAVLLASAALNTPSGVGPAGGADYVANAVKSYDVFADVRTANVPQLVSGQTLSITVQGGAIIGDGLGGSFYWSGTSTAADDGRTVLKPNTLAGTAAGRWLRYYPLGVPQIVALASTTAFTTNTALTSIVGFTANIAANAIYRARLQLQILGAGATSQGWKAALVASGGSSIASGGGGGGVVSGNGTAVVTASAVGATMSNAAVSDTATAPDMLDMSFIFTTGTGGYLQVQAAQESSSADSTSILAGSILELTRLA